MLTVSSDTAPPSVTAVVPAPGRVTALTQLTVTFSKPILGLDAADLLINERPALLVTKVNESGTEWRFDFAKPAYGRVNISWADTHDITDRFTPPHAFGATQATARWEYDFVDITPPWDAEILPSPGATVSALQEVVITFSEPVTGVVAADLELGQ